MTCMVNLTHCRLSEFKTWVYELALMNCGSTEPKMYESKFIDLSPWPTHSNETESNPKSIVNANNDLQTQIYVLGPL